MAAGSINAASVVALLLSWWERHGRGFPWRQWDDPYHLLLTEILLRQTRAESVAAYLPGFLQRYPSPHALAAAGEDQLTAALKPLGFNRQRARQLCALAVRIVAAGGHVPSDLQGLLALPGVGQYTAGMVAATTAGVQVPAVDTNVARVLCRVFGLIPSHAEPRKSRNVWDLAAGLVAESGNAVHLTWAILDLAAAVCKPKLPRCAECPLQEECCYGRHILLPSGIERGEQLTDAPAV